MQYEAQCTTKGIITFPQFYVNTPLRFCDKPRHILFCFSLEIEHSEREDITSYYHPGISEYCTKNSIYTVYDEMRADV